MSVRIVTHNSLTDFRNWLERRFPTDGSATKASDFNVRANYGWGNSGQYFSLASTQQRTRDRGQRWFGTRDADSVFNKPTEYLDKALMESIFDRISNQIDISSTNKLEKRKMTFNDMGIGLFSFDRASQTMSYVFEYYSPSLGMLVGEENVIKIGDNKYISKLDGKPLIKRHKKNERATAKKKEGYRFYSPVFEEYIDYVPKVKTATKKVFVYFPKSVQMDDQGFKIVIIAGGNEDKTATQLLHSTMAGIKLAQALDLAGYPVQISAMYASRHGRSGDIVGTEIIIKRFDEIFDLNLISLMGSDPRIFRFEAFKALISASDDFNVTIPSGLGSMDDSIVEPIEDYLNENKPVKNTFVFGLTYDVPSIINSYNAKIDEIREVMEQAQTTTP